MATSAFKSTTKRTSIGGGADDSSSTNLKSSVHRRSRSLSRFSRRLPTQPTADDFDEVPAPRAKFVNTVRGSGFPEISLDDLAIELFDSANRGRLPSRNFGSSPASGSGEISQNQRRGRSVSRQRANGDGRSSVCNSSVRGRVVSEANSRRRRSVSVVRYQISDSESDLDHSQNSESLDNLKRSSSGNKQAFSFNKQAAANNRPALRRSTSQKDLKPYDGYSSHSSVITDDEGRDAYPNRSGTGRTERATYAHKKVERLAGIKGDNGLYEAMRKELRHAVNDIKLEIEQAVVKTKDSSLENSDSKLPNDSDVMNAVSSIRKNYATKLEQSEKRKQDLLAEIVLEEQRGRELCKVVKELLPDINSNGSEILSRARKGSNDRNRMSKRLTEEAEKYIEDFISNVEDTTDISSLDGERSDTSSSIGGITKQEAFHSPAMSSSLPVEMDGVVFPWLKWETCNDASPMTCLNKTQLPTTPTNADTTQDIIKVQERSNHTVSSHGSWSPGVVDGLQLSGGKDLKSKYGEYFSQPRAIESEGFHPHIDDYLKRQTTEDFLVERWQQRHRISSGGLLVCQQVLF